MIRVSLTLWHFSTFIIKKCFLPSAGAAVFSNEGKGKPYSATSDSGDRQIMGSYLRVHLLSCVENHLCSDHICFQGLTLRNKNVILSYFIVWLSYIHIFFSNLTIMEALTFVKTWVLCPSVNGMDQWGRTGQNSPREHFQKLSSCHGKQYSILNVNQLYTWSGLL